MRVLRVIPAVLVLLPVAAGSVAAASLEKELAGLLLDHPNINAAAKALESSRKEIGKARATFFPIVSATADIGQELVDSPGVRAAAADGKLISRTPQSGNLTVTQNLFNGFLSTSNMRTARLNKELAAITLEGTRQNTTFEGIATYIDVLKQKRLVDLSRETEITIQRQLNLEDERVQRGSGVAVDVLQAKSRLQIAKERRVALEGALKDSMSRYTQVFNHLPDLEAMMDPVPPVEMVPSSLERAVEIAVVENPAVNTATTNIEVVRERQRSIRSELFPTVDLEGQFNFEKHANTVIGVRRDYSMFLRASWNLFTGLSTRDSLSQALYDYQASQDSHTFTARQVVQQTKLTWQALLTARDRLELLENAVNIASEVFESRKKLREAGKETVINVLDAENEVNNSQINFTSASYDERVAVYQLLLAMGRLNPVNLGIGSIY